MSDLSRTLASWTYENVAFPATETRVEWGHDSAKHQGYGQRGADIETTGQKPRVITATIPLRNGLRWPGERLYPETYLKLREAFKTAEGFLTHPTLGLVTVHVDSVSERIDPTKPDGLDIEVSFTEQRAESQELELALASRSTPADAAAAEASAADKAAASLAGLAATDALADNVAAAFGYLAEAARTGPDAASTFGALVADLDARLSDPAASDAAWHDYRSALVRCRAAVLSARAESIGSTEALTITLGETMSLARAAAQAYGDPSRAAELAAKNRIGDPLFIAAGTVLAI